jgi:hypothetical protein
MRCIRSKGVNQGLIAYKPDKNAHKECDIDHSVEIVPFVVPPHFVGEDDDHNVPNREGKDADSDVHRHLQLVVGLGGFVQEMSMSLLPLLVVFVGIGILELKEVLLHFVFLHQMEVRVENGDVVLEIDSDHAEDQHFYHVSDVHRFLPNCKL